MIALPIMQLPRLRQPLQLPLARMVAVGGVVDAARVDAARAVGAGAVARAVEVVAVVIAPRVARTPSRESVRHAAREAVAGEAREAVEAGAVAASRTALALPGASTSAAMALAVGGFELVQSCLANICSCVN